MQLGLTLPVPGATKSAVTGPGKYSFLDCKIRATPCYPQGGFPGDLGIRNLLDLGATPAPRKVRWDPAGWALLSIGNEKGGLGEESTGPGTVLGPGGR